jgi:imidazolonepropionase-like amidohydrolase
VTRITNKLAREGVFVCPTLAVFERRAGKKAATAVEAHAFDNMLQFTAACHKAGVALVVGSHTSGPLARRGKAYLREMELLVEAGMEPLEVITAATETNARFFGVAERLGTIEPGKLADLVIVRGDPSRRIQDIDQVERVMLNGIWVDRPSDR